MKQQHLQATAIGFVLYYIIIHIFKSTLSWTVKSENHNFFVNKDSEMSVRRTQVCGQEFWRCHGGKGQLEHFFVMTPMLRLFSWSLFTWNAFAFCHTGAMVMKCLFSPVNSPVVESQMSLGLTFTPCLDEFSGILSWIKHGVEMQTVFAERVSLSVILISTRAWI